VFGLFVEHDGRRVLKQWLPYVVAIADLTAASLWYWHAHGLGQLTGLSFGLFDKTGDLQLVLSVQFYLKILARLAKDILGPVGVAAAAVGLIIAVHRRLWPEILGVAAFIAYVILVAAGNDVHDYYQVAVVPVAVMLIAIGFRDGIRFLSRTDRGRLIGVTLALAAMLSSTFVRSVSFHSWYEYDLDRVQLCRDLQPQLRSHDLVAFLDYPSPDLLFCLDRHGWLFGTGAWSAGDLLTVWRQGAAVLVFPASVSAADLPRAMNQRSVLITRSGHLSAYRLEPFPRDREAAR